jgi:hypothetical protein
MSAQHIQFTHTFLPSTSFSQTSHISKYILSGSPPASGLILRTRTSVSALRSAVRSLRSHHFDVSCVSFGDGDEQVRVFHATGTVFKSCASARVDRNNGWNQCMYHRSRRHLLASGVKHDKLACACRIMSTSRQFVLCADDVEPRTNFNRGCG